MSHTHQKLYGGTSLDVLSGFWCSTLGDRDIAALRLWAMTKKRSNLGCLCEFKSPKPQTKHDYEIGHQTQCRAVLSPQELYVLNK